MRLPPISFLSFPSYTTIPSPHCNYANHLSYLQNSNNLHQSSHQVRNTQRAIKHALTERWYAWEEANKLSRADPEIRYRSAKGTVPKYKPSVYEVRTLIYLSYYAGRAIAYGI